MPVESLHFEYKSLIKNPRKVSESICAMANTEGGMIEIGRDSTGGFIGLDAKETDDAQKRLFDAVESVKPAPNHRIDVEQIGERYLASIVVERMTEGAFCTLGGIPYVRSGSVDYKLEGSKLKDFLSQRLIVTYDELASPARVEDVDDDLLQNFLKIRNPKIDFDPSKKRQYLMGIHALVDFEEGALKNAAALFFTKRPRDFIRQHEIRLVRFSTKERVEIVDQVALESPLPHMLDECVAFIKRNIQHAIRTEGLRGIQIPEYPVDAVREAIINMIAHRDYLSRDACQVNIHPDRIEFLNPGKLPYGLTLRSLGSHAIHRNPLIYDLMRDLELMEGVGTGVAKMRELARRDGLPPIEFTELDTFFMLTMRNKTAFTSATRSERLNAIASLAAEKGDISSADVAAMMGISITQASLDLKELVNAGNIERTGKTRGTRYRLRDRARYP